MRCREAGQRLSSASPAREQAPEKYGSTNANVAALMSDAGFTAADWRAALLCVLVAGLVDLPRRWSTGGREPGGCALRGGEQGGVVRRPQWASVVEEHVLEVADPAALALEEIQEHVLEQVPVRRPRLAGVGLGVSADEVPEKLRVPEPLQVLKAIRAAQALLGDHGHRESASVIDSARIRNKCFRWRAALPAVSARRSRW